MKHYKYNVYENYESHIMIINSQSWISHAQSKQGECFISQTCIRHWLNFASIKHQVNLPTISNPNLLYNIPHPWLCSCERHKPVSKIIVQTSLPWSHRCLLPGISHSDRQTRGQVGLCFPLPRTPTGLSHPRHSHLPLSSPKPSSLPLQRNGHSKM